MKTSFRKMSRFIFFTLFVLLFATMFKYNSYSLKIMTAFVLAYSLLITLSSCGRIFSEEIKYVEKLQAQFEAQMRKMFQKTFILDFTRAESMYKEEQVLDAPKVPQQNGLMVIFEGSGSSEELYKNLNEQRIANKKTIPPT